MSCPSQNTGFYWMHVCSGTASLRVSYVLAVRQQLLAAFRMCSRAQHSRSAGVLRLRHFVVLRESGGTVTSENL